MAGRCWGASEGTDTECGCGLQCPSPTGFVRGPRGLARATVISLLLHLFLGVECPELGLSRQTDPAGGMFCIPFRMCDLERLLVSVPEAQCLLENGNEA